MRAAFAARFSRIWKHAEACVGHQPSAGDMRKELRNDCAKIL